MLYHKRLKRHSLYSLFFLGAILCFHWLINAAEKEQAVIPLITQPSVLEDILVTYFPADHNIKQIITKYVYGINASEGHQELEDFILYERGGFYEYRSMDQEILQQLDAKDLIIPLNNTNLTGLSGLYLRYTTCFRDHDNEKIKKNILNKITTVLQQYPDSVNAGNNTLYHFAALYSVRNGIINHDFFDILIKTNKIDWRKFCSYARRNTFMILVSQNGLRFNPIPEQAAKDRNLLTITAHGNDINQVNMEEGYTPLHEALLGYASDEVICFLVELKADPHKDCNQTTPIELAIVKQRSPGLIEFLQNVGKNPTKKHH